MFTLSEDKNQRINSLSLSVNKPLVRKMTEFYFARRDLHIDVGVLILFSQVYIG